MATPSHSGGRSPVRGSISTNLVETGVKVASSEEKARSSRSMGATEFAGRAIKTAATGREYGYFQHIQDSAEPLHGRTPGCLSPQLSSRQPVIAFRGMQWRSKALILSTGLRVLLVGLILISMHCLTTNICTIEVLVGLDLHAKEPEVQ